MSIIAKLLGRKPEPAETAAETEPQNHRRTNRDGTYKVVTVTYPTGYERKGVAVDISPTGVRIRFSQRGELPPLVELKITGVAGVRPAEVVWQEAHDAGLRFVR